MAPIITLRGFWDSLYTSPIYPILIGYFETLFADVKQGRVYVYSIFNGVSPPPRDQRETDALYVHFSGEGHYAPPADFDISLIPHLPGPGIIPHPLASTDIHVNNLLPYILNRPREPPPHQTRFCAFVVSNGAPVERRRFFNMLNERKHVDSWGGAMNNMNGHRPPADFNSKGYFDFLSSYKFMIAFENNKIDYYLTEKLINAYAGGCIPIYWGCPQVTEILNPRAFLLIDKAECPDMASMIEKVLALDADDEAYRRMFAEPLFIDNKIPDMFNVKVFSQHIAEAANEL